MARPRFKPSVADFKTVQTLSAYGIPEEQIAIPSGPAAFPPRPCASIFIVSWPPE